LAKKAVELARDEMDEERKKRLEEIAKACNWVPANPPRTIREAMQFFWLIHVIIHQIEFIAIGIGARLDVLFNPYYIKDKEEGRISKDGARNY
jgi:formate C-acetyltransferase